MVRWWKTILSLFVVSTALYGVPAFAETLEVFSGAVKAQGQRLSFQIGKANAQELWLRLDTKDKAPAFQLALDGRRLVVVGANRISAQAGGWVSIPVDALVFEDGSKESVDAAFSRLKKFEIWVHASRKVLAGELRCGPKKIPVRIAFKSIEPRGILVKQRSVRFAMKTEPATATIECRLDGAAWKACASETSVDSLKLGWHRFEARAVLANRNNVDRSSAVRHDFYVLNVVPAITIRHTVPSEFPTESDSLTVEFTIKKPLLFPARAVCQLDDGKKVECKSPWKLKGLAQGNHRIRIYRVNSPFAWDTYSKPAELTWEIRAQTPVLRWVQTPPTLGNQTASTFEFASDLAATFECRLDGGNANACTSPAVFRDLNEGTHELEVVAQSSSGKTSAPLRYSWTLDRTAADLVMEFHPTSQFTASRNMDASWTASEPVETACSFDGGLFVPCQSPATRSDLSEGSHQFQVRATDRAGNISFSSERVWTVKTSLPRLSVTMVSPTRSPSSATSAHFVVETDADATVECYLNGSMVRIEGSDIVLDSLFEGLHHLECRASDLAGNTVGPEVRNWVIDQTPPTVTLSQFYPSEPISGTGNFEMYFAANEEVNFDCSIDGVVTTGCSSPWVGNSLADGVHKVTLRATDLAGNQSGEITQEWRIAANPIAVLDSVEPVDVLSNRRDATFTFHSEVVNEFECSLDGGAFSACSSPHTYSGLSDGEHRFVVHALNPLGVPGMDTEYVWSIDASAPVLTIVSVNPPQGSVSPSTDFYIEFTADEPVSTLCKLDGGMERFCDTPYEMSGLSPGPHRLEVSAIDAIGNTSTYEHRWTVVTDPLVFENGRVDGVTNHSAVLSFQTNLPSQALVHWILPLGQIDLNFSDFEASRTVELNNLAPNTLYQLQVTVTDAYGRTATSPVFSFRTLR